MANCHADLVQALQVEVDGAEAEVDAPSALVPPAATYGLGGRE